MNNDYDSDAIREDLEDYDEIKNQEINKTNSNLYNICNNQQYISSIARFINNDKCMTFLYAIFVHQMIERSHLFL